MSRTTKLVDLNKYKVWILDFDGTLYYQFPVRLIMGFWLVIYYFLHPWRIREFLIILEYRKLRENLSGETFSEDNPSDLIIKLLCSRYQVSSNDIKKILKSWTEIKPCLFINVFQRSNFVKTIRKYQEKGVLMIVYSDNPLQEKIKAVSFVPQFFFDSDHELIRCLKPNTQGLNNLISFLGTKPEEIAYIGDRDERDGICAKNAGIDYYDINTFEI